MKRLVTRRAVLAGGLALLAAACGGSDERTPTVGAPAATTSSGSQSGASGSATTSAPTAGDDTPTNAAAPTRAPTEGEPTVAPTDTQPAATPTATAHVLTPDELQQYQPNELGQVVVLEYHQLAGEPAQFVRTAEQFRGDLQWLYDSDFRIVKLHDLLANTIDLPAGKKPVILTFDDSSAGQFRLLKQADGSVGIDANCMIGMLETFYAEHPDFGRGGAFAVLPNSLFNWTVESDEPDQTEYGEMKLKWLVDNGYEIANHTIDHVDLSTLTDDEVMYQLAAANDAIHAIVPDVEIEAVTLPFGMYPDGGDDTLLRGFEYNGKQYSWKCALEVGANPALCFLSTDYDPYATGRIQAFDEELAKWKGIFADNPGILYVSDGNPQTVTVPNDLHPWLVGTLDESKIRDRQLIRY